MTTRYPGASARTVIDTVALPIEQQVNGVENMLYMQSTSAADGTYTLTVTFEIGTDLDIAQVLVQNRVSSALSSLPECGADAGRHGAEAIDGDPAVRHADLAGRDATTASISRNYATINLRDELARLPGVGNVTVFGAGQYSMRIWLDPNKLQARGLMPQDVIQAIQQQSQQVAAGQVGAPPAPPGRRSSTRSMSTAGSTTPSEFEDIIVKTGSNGDVTRVRDVGRVELGAQTYSQMFTLNDKPAAGIGVFQSPGANALEVEKAVEKQDGGAGAAISAGLDYDDAVRHHHIRHRDRSTKSTRR